MPSSEAGSDDDDFTFWVIITVLSSTTVVFFCLLIAVRVCKRRKDRSDVEEFSDGDMRDGSAYSDIILRDAPSMRERPDPRYSHLSGRTPPAPPAPRSRATTVLNGNYVDASENKARSGATPNQMYEPGSSDRASVASGVYDVADPSVVDRGASQSPIISPVEYEDAQGIASNEQFSLDPLYAVPRGTSDVACVIQSLNNSRRDAAEMQLVPDLGYAEPHAAHDSNPIPSRVVYNKGRGDGDGDGSDGSSRSPHCHLSLDPEYAVPTPLPERQKGGS